MPARIPSVTLSVSYRVLTLSGTTGLSFVTAPASAMRQTFTGTLSNVNAAPMVSPISPQSTISDRKR